MEWVAAVVMEWVAAVVVSAVMVEVGATSTWQQDFPVGLGAVNISDRDLTHHLIRLKFHERKN